MTLRPRRLILLPILAVLVLVGACGSSANKPGASTSPATTKATVLLDWFPNPDHIALYTAQKQGDFAAAGLDVTLQAPSGTTDGIKLVNLGQVPLAISYEPEVLVAKAKGIDVTAVASLVPTALNSLIISGKKGISGPTALAGKTIGSSGLDTDEVFLKAIGSHYNVDPASFKVIAVNQTLLQAMVSGNVDAIIGGYRNIEGIELADRGLDPQVIPVSEAGVPPYDELVVIANTSKLKSDPAYQATVRKFLAGLAKGDAAVQANPSSALPIMKSVDKGDDPAVLQKMIDATAPLLKNPAGFGAIDVKQWQAFADWMKGDGLIDKAVDASTVVDTRFLP